MEQPQSFNANPRLFTPASDSYRKKQKSRLWALDDHSDESDDEEDTVIDEQEIFDLLRSITDPEHPRTLEELNVISRKQVRVRGNIVDVEFTPTNPGCGMAHVIGLAIVVRLIRSLPPRFKLNISLTQGSHQSAAQVMKQLNDKERVSAAMEVDALMESINTCLATAGRRGSYSE
ncbi:hypothetical protein BOTBODRAFT_144024 [Botryobasidium botryosum FD-172 SS1]|uniref:MIP18 family-like domain-containing protein n=1 Tax=Botryobasidium botryosum (strain FD-172 SS1) TaxID=930990 RepID=A0A067N0L7_BOTB1|nr:hypothetical protein BOTBODRAFT_144024 [Botryobasidium botryosum FD-172 SS1]